MQRKRSERQTLHLNVFGCTIIIRVCYNVALCVTCCVYVCVCVCVCVCVVCVRVCASDVLKNCTVLFAQRIHLHKGV